MIAATPEDQIVTIRDIRTEKLCLRGARNWFELQDGFSWQEFMENKYTVAELESTGDPLAFRVCKQARERWAQGGQ